MVKQIKFGMNKMEGRAWQRAYSQGADAAERGVSRFNNPYREGTIEYRGWSRGWDAIDMTRTMLRNNVQNS